MTVDLTAGTASGGDIGNDTVTNTENVDTGTGADNVTGDDGNNVINSGAGADTVAGGGGDDNINGGDGDDVIIVPAGTPHWYSQIDGWVTYLEIRYDPGTN